MPAAARPTQTSVESQPRASAITLARARRGWSRARCASGDEAVAADLVARKGDAVD